MESDCANVAIAMVAVKMMNIIISYNCSSKFGNSNCNYSDNTNKVVVVIYPK